VLNDTPVACQTRGPTDPQGDRWRGAVPQAFPLRAPQCAHWGVHSWRCQRSWRMRG